MSGILQAAMRDFRTYGVTGQAAYTTSGSYTWVAPVGVTSISIVSVGSGGGGTYTNNCGIDYLGLAGGGGGLAYRNNYPVTPGTSYTVYVAAGTICNGSSSGFVVSGLPMIALANGGKSGLCMGCGGTYCTIRSTGGGTGGKGGAAYSNQWGGGGGAAGYTGNGGRGGFAGTGCGGIGAAGSGGGGGGGGGGFQNQSGSGGGGGGVGILGQGTNGAGGAYGASARGGGGSGGEGLTCTGLGGAYGGGGGGAGNNFARKAGAKGAVRIIWPGTSRSFPSTNTGDL